MALIEYKNLKHVTAFPSTCVRTLFLLTTFIVPISLDSVAQESNVVREYTRLESQDQYQYLLTEFGSNKELPVGLELQGLLALSHYPELKNTKIRFILGDVSIPISSRPHWASMLRSAKNRTYQVIIDTNREGTREALLVKNQPFNAQIGIIGHELAHTVYYLDRSFFHILRDAICQLSDCRINFERATDRRLIEYGLGWQRYDHASFVRGRFTSNSGVASSFEASTGPYMNPTELLQIMRSNPDYIID